MMVATICVTVDGRDTIGFTWASRIEGRSVAYIPVVSHILATRVRRRHQPQGWQH